MDLGVSAGALALLALALAGAGLVTGFLAGLLGIGGGGILVPVLYEVFTVLGVDAAIRMHLAVGTSLAVIAPISRRGLELAFGGFLSVIAIRYLVSLLT